MSTVARKLLVGSTISLFVANAYPIVRPNSFVFESDDTFLTKDDPVVQLAHSIASKAGVDNPDSIEVRLSNDNSGGGALGSNFMNIHFGSALSITLPAGIYSAYVDELRHGGDSIKEEMSFLLAHESAHLAKNHCLQMATFLPSSLLAASFAAQRIPNKLIATVISLTAMAAGNFALSWQIEHEADHIAAAQVGFAKGGIQIFQRTAAANQSCRLQSSGGLNSLVISEQGNYFIDAWHPWLSIRIHHLEGIIALASEEQCHHGSNCEFCCVMRTMLTKGWEQFIDRLGIA